MLTAFIPAKGISKRVPDKNMLYLFKKRLIQWTLDICEQWNEIDKVVVATENKQIANYCIQRCRKLHQIYNLSDDDINDNRTVSNLWKEYAANKNEPQILMHITNPFRDIKELDAAFNIFLTAKYDIIISAIEEKRAILNHEGIPFDIKSRMNDRSQDRKPNYILSGSFYISSPDYIRSCEYFEQGRAYLFPIKRKNALEVDTMEDFELLKNIVYGELNE